MNILIDIGHPAHVHIFKEVAAHFEKRGDRVLFTVREGENEAELLLKNSLSYKVLGRKRRTGTGKFLGLFLFTFKILIISLKFKPDMFLSHGSMYAGIVSFIVRRPHITLEDTGNMEQLRLSSPFSTVILSPDTLKLNLGSKHIKYNGSHELFYLAPSRFTPSEEVLTILKIKRGENYCILRFISWGATHDFGHSGLSDIQKVELVKGISKIMKVFICAEGSLPEELIQYKLPLHPSNLHSALAFASLVISEGATIASESTLLGVPVIYINSRESDVLTALEKIELLFQFKSFNGLLEKISEITSGGFSREELLLKRDKMLSSKIDVLKFFIWFLEEYPMSYEIMKGDPQFHKKFMFEYYN